MASGFELTYLLLPSAPPILVVFLSFIYFHVTFFYGDSIEIPHAQDDFLKGEHPAYNGRDTTNLFMPGEDIVPGIQSSFIEPIEVGQSRPLCSLAEYSQISGIRAFGALRNFEFHLISLFQGFKPLPLNGRVMDEYILRAFYLNKPKSLLIIEPLDSTFRHYNLP